MYREHRNIALQVECLLKHRKQNKGYFILGMTIFPLVATGMSILRYSMGRYFSMRTATGTLSLTWPCLETHTHTRKMNAPVTTTFQKLLISSLRLEALYCPRVYMLIMSHGTESFTNTLYAELSIHLNLHRPSKNSLTGAPWCPPPPSSDQATHLLSSSSTSATSMVFLLAW